MTKLKLPQSGREVDVRIYHIRYSDGRVKRFTQAIVYDGSKVVAEATAVCNPHDMFNKKVGRKVAATKLMKELKDKFCKTDRRAIFEAVCPEYKKNTQVSFDFNALDLVLRVFDMKRVF